MKKILAISISSILLIILFSITIYFVLKPKKTAIYITGPDNEKYELIKTNFQKASLIGPYEKNYNFKNKNDLDKFKEELKNDKSITFLKNINNVDIILKDNCYIAIEYKEENTTITSLFAKKMNEEKVLLYPFLNGRIDKNIFSSRNIFNFKNLDDVKDLLKIIAKNNIVNYDKEQNKLILKYSKTKNNEIEQVELDLNTLKIDRSTYSIKINLIK